MLQRQPPRDIQAYRHREGDVSTAKRKIVLKLKDIGYTLEEIKTTISVILALHSQEIYDICNSLETTVLEKMLASAVLQSLGNGDLDALETMIERAYGKARPALETAKKTKLHTIDATKVDAIAASNIYREMMTA